MSRPLQHLLRAVRILFGAAASLLVLSIGAIFVVGVPDPPYIPSDPELVVKMVMLSVLGLLSGWLAIRISADARGGLMGMAGATVLVIVALIEVLVLIQPDRPPNWVRPQGDLIWRFHTVVRGAVVVLGYAAGARRRDGAKPG